MPSIVTISGRQDNAYARNQSRNLNTPYIVTNENIQKLIAANAIQRVESYSNARNFKIDPRMISVNAMSSIWQLLENLSVMIGKTPIPYDECIANSGINFPEVSEVPTLTASELDEIRHSLEHDIEQMADIVSSEPGIDMASLSRRYGQTTDPDTRQLLSDIYRGRICNDDFDIIDITQWQHDNENLSFADHTLYGCSCSGCVVRRAEARLARESRR